ncbi:CRISPR-associated protein Cas1 [Fimbriiglobus ruber]|uniref:CRISPR-associated endonuclease Cas1 n=1 Tax=Fimbriiglobus ruber TaxID=1908690 RepID=A0A225DXQ7_9BACT|nr:CRISPR-associated protein Cas1 [Fimbriiglobus ruber]
MTSVQVPVAHLVGPGQLKMINGHLAFKRQGDGPLRLDPTALTVVCCYGDVSVTGAALDLLFRHRVDTAWFTPAGARCRGRLAGTDARTTGTRVRQHRVFASAVHRRDWARLVVAGKIETMATAARRYQRNQVSTGTLLTDLGAIAEQVPAAETADAVRGLEGAASAAWFRFLGGLFRPPWAFTTRSRRPPADPVNALLSLGYTWLLNRATAGLEAGGYEPQLGGLHEYRAGRPSLSCDLIEPLRVPAVDRWVVGACGQDEIAPDQFVVEESGGFRLQPKAFGTAVYLWEKSWQEAGADDTLREWIAALATFLRERSDPTDESESPDL